MRKSTYFQTERPSSPAARGERVVTGGPQEEPESEHGENAGAAQLLGPEIGGEGNRERDGRLG